MSTPEENSSSALVPNVQTNFSPKYGSRLYYVDLYDFYDCMRSYDVPFAFFCVYRRARVCTLPSPSCPLPSRSLCFPPVLLLFLRTPIYSRLYCVELAVFVKSQMYLCMLPGCNLNSSPGGGSETLRQNPKTRLGADRQARQGTQPPSLQTSRLHMHALESLTACREVEGHQDEFGRSASALKPKFRVVPVSSSSSVRNSFYIGE